MSMMDAMSMGAQPAQNQAPEAQGNQYMRMGVNKGEEGLREIFNRVMELIAEELWEKSGHTTITNQFLADESEPAEIVGKFTGLYAQIAVTAAHSKGAMIPPFVMISVIAETSAMITDIALAARVVDPQDADDTADAGALIGIEVLLSQSRDEMSPEEYDEYRTIANNIIAASPHAEEMAEEGTEDVLEDIEEDPMLLDPQGVSGADGNPQAAADMEANQLAGGNPNANGMAAAMGAV